MTVASLSAISGPKFVMYTSKSARTSPFMAKKSGSNLSTPEGLSGRGGRKLSASRFMESVLGGLGLAAPKHEQFLTVPGEHQSTQQLGAVEGAAGDGQPRHKSKSLAQLFPRNASNESLSSRAVSTDDEMAATCKAGSERVDILKVDNPMLPRVEITDTDADAPDGDDKSVCTRGEQEAPKGSERTRKSGIAQQSIILEELRQIKKLRQIMDTPGVAIEASSAQRDRDYD